ncbi:MAG: RsmE family RNA methyltransferase [Bernardetiaceae bacterium]
MPTQTTIFYHPDLEKDTFQLDPEEAKHLKTLRIRAGHTLELVDGKGHRVRAVVRSPAVKDCQLEIVERYPLPPPPAHRIHIAVAPTKSSDRIEWLLEKTIEIGIDRLTLIQTQHSVRTQLKPERLYRKGLAAMKQSLRAHMPAVEGVLSLEELFGQATEEHRFIAHNGKEVVAHLQEVAPKAGSYLVLVGPEGGFSEEELTFAAEAGCLPVLLGDSRLRTETAALVACLTLQLLNT